MKPKSPPAILVAGSLFPCPPYGASDEFLPLFVDRPVFAAVLSILILVAGLIGLRALPISEYPEVVPPSVVVRAVYPGANPTVISQTVATPLEEQINGVENMLYMSSQATSDGVLTLTVTFRLGTDPDKAQQLVQNRVAQAEPRLPAEVRALGVTTVKSSPDLMMVVHLVSTGDRYDLTYLRNYATLNVKDRLARIEGVGQVQVFGAGDYSMRIWLDPQKVAEHGLAASDITSAIAQQNVQAAAGTIGASPSLEGVDLQLNINARGRLQTPEEFGAIVVKSGPNGEITRLADLARIELGAAEYALRSLLDGEPAVAIPIFQALAPTPLPYPMPCSRRWPICSRRCPTVCASRLSTIRRNSCGPRSTRSSIHFSRRLRSWCSW